MIDICKIDLKATLEKAGMTPYKFAQEINRHRNQVYPWIRGHRNISVLWQEKILAYCSENDIEVVKKS